jgi:enoyl-CoA hydratase/carnithine racemase
VLNSETIKVESPGEAVAVVSLNRPERLNAISPTMFEELLAACKTLGASESVRVVVLTGSGRGFCAGLDLESAEDLPRLTASEVQARQEYYASIIPAIRALPQPVIAAVNGPAAGGGLGLALAADIRVASTSASFNTAFVRIGLSAGDLGVSWALPRLVGLGLAAELMYTARPVDADEALALGLVNRVVPDAELLSASLELADQIAANGAFGLRLSKRVLQINVDTTSLESALELENRGQALAWQEPGMAEALRAFRDKRKPRGDAQ